MEIGTVGMALLTKHSWYGRHRIFIGRLVLVFCLIYLVVIFASESYYFFIKIWTAVVLSGGLGPASALDEVAVYMREIDNYIG